MREENLESGRKPRVDGERSDVGKSLTETLREWVGGGGRRREERMAPRGDERDVQVGDGSKTGRDHKHVTRVATKCDGAARRSLMMVEFAIHQRQGVARASVGYGGAYVRQNGVGKVVDAGFSLAQLRHRG